MLTTPGQHAAEPAEVAEPPPPRLAFSESRPTPSAAKITIPEISILIRGPPPAGEAQQLQFAAFPLDPLSSSGPPAQQEARGTPSPVSDSIPSSRCQGFFAFAG